MSTPSGIENRTHDMGESVSFALASCLYPAGMLDGSVTSIDRIPDLDDIGPADRTLWHLAQCCADTKLSAVILAGDQVYVDATAGLFDAAVLADRLRVAYERLKQNATISKLHAGTLVLPLMDDHEIHDNWDGPEAALDSTGLNPPQDKDLLDAKKKFLSFWTNRRPADSHLWEELSVDGFRFFFTDTRTERVRRTHNNWDSARIFSCMQACHLFEWIKQCAGGQPAFIVSPAMLVPRPLLLGDDEVMALHVDAWSGFPHSFKQLLVWLYDARASNIVFLSGDEHVSCIASLTIQQVGLPAVVRVYSIHSSAAYAPFVFANAREEDFAAPECFQFTSSEDKRKFECRVEVISWCSGDGFALLTPTHEPDGGWTLKVAFHRHDSRISGDQSGLHGTREQSTKLQF